MQSGSGIMLELQLGGKKTDVGFMAKILYNKSLCSHFLLGEQKIFLSPCPPQLVHILSC
jgi:hypothetical protein